MYTETAVRSLLRPFAIQSLSVFAAGLPDELLLCPVRSLSEYVAKTSRFVNRPRRLFVSSCSSYIFIIFKNTKNLFIHIARIPIGDSPRDIPTF